MDIATAIAGLNGTPLDPGAAPSIQSGITTVFNKILNLSNLFYANLETATQLFFSSGRVVSISTIGSPAVPALNIHTTPTSPAPPVPKLAFCLFLLT